MTAQNEHLNGNDGPDARHNTGPGMTTLQQRIELYRSLVETADDLIFQTDAQGRFVYVNRNALERMQAREEEILGRRYTEFVHPDFRVRLESFYREAVHTPERITYLEFLAQPLKGASFWIGQKVRIIPGSEGGAYVVARDITEQKTLEEKLRLAKEDAEESANLKSQFLATVSHEIRTPLNGVIGMTDMLLRTDLTRQQQEYVATIRTSGELLLGLINDIIDYSRIESGRMELEPAPFDLRTCIEDVLTALAPAAADRGVELVSLFDPGLPAMVVADGQRVRQVIMNLVGNAVKFTEKGEIIVSAVLESHDEENAGIGICVRDTGIGIAPDRLDRLFQAFSQLDGSMTRRYGGTGLGLAIASRLVALMGGAMGVRSEFGKGSEFFFSIRFRKAASRGIVQHPLLRCKRVMIVDDNNAARESLVRYAAAWGTEPVPCGSAAAALDLLRGGGAFHVVILDRFLPDMEAERFADQLRRSLDAAAPPVILLDPHAHRAARAETSALFTAVAAKPIRREELQKLLIRLFSDREEAGKGGRGADARRPRLTDFPYTILLAEDNVINQRLTLQMLKELGAVAELAGNGKEAVTMLQQKFFDIVLMDIQMPEMDGYEATAWILHSMPPERRPVIIALTANAMEGDREKCLKAGMDDYMSKPVRLNGLLAMLQHWAGVLRRRKAGLHIEETLRVQLDKLLIDTEPAFMDEFMDLLVQSVQGLLKEIEDALAARDPKRLAIAAHSLKGSSRNVGAAALQNAAAALEESTERGELDYAESHLPDLRDSVHNAVLEFRAYQQYLRGTAGNQ